MFNRRYFLQQLGAVGISATTLELFNSQLHFFSDTALADTGKTVNLFNLAPNLAFDFLDPILEGVSNGVGDLLRDSIDSINPYTAQRKQDIIDLVRDNLREYQNGRIEEKLLEIQGKWDLYNWKGIISRQETEKLLNKSDTLLILFAPPRMSEEVPLSIRHNLMIDFGGIKNRLKTYYKEDQIYKVKFYSDYFKDSIGDIIIDQLYSILSPIPTAIFYTDITDYYCRFNVGYWNLKSDEPKKISSKLWYWEDSALAMKENGVDDVNIQRNIRNSIISCNQLLASYFIDISYLSIDPFFPIKFPQFTANLIQNLKDKQEYVAPYLLKLEEIKNVEIAILEDTLAEAKIRLSAEKWQLVNTIQASNSCLFSVAIHPNNNIIACEGDNHTVSIWDRKTGQHHSLYGHSDGILSLAFSPDGSTLLSASKDKTIISWKNYQSNEVKTLTGHSDWVRSVSFSPDGTIVASGSHDHTIKLWNTQTGKCLHTLTGHSNWVQSVSFSPNGSIVASANNDKTIKLWNTQTGECLHTLKGHSDLVHSVSFSPDSSILASSSHDHTIKLWNTQTGQYLSTLSSLEGDLGINSVTFSPDGSILASDGKDNKINLWNWQTGKCLRTLEGHSGLMITTMAFSPDGSILATGSSDKTIKLWDYKTGECLRTLKGHSDWVSSIAFSSDSYTLASASRDDTIKVWDYNIGKCLGTIDVHLDYGVSTIAFSPDGYILASNNGYDIKLQQVPFYKFVIMNSDWVRCLAFSPDNSMIATGSDDDTITLRTSDNKNIRTIRGHKGNINGITFTSDSKVLASGSEDKTIKLWNCQTRQCLNTLIGHSDSVRCVAFSPDGTVLASGSNDKTIKLWDWKTGKCLNTLIDHGSAVTSISFSSDQSTLISGSDDKTIKIWYWRTGELLNTLTGHSNYVTSVNISSDQHTLVSCSCDKTIEVWGNA